MQILKAVAIMTFVYILPFVIAGPSVAKPKLISTLKDQFTLRVLAPDSKGKINLKHSDPLIAELPELEKPGFTVYPETALANTDATVFSLENNKLILGSYTAALTPSDTNIYGGFRSFVFASDVETEPVNFTATKASDSYGKSFLRLGSDDGQNPFVVVDRTGGDVFYKIDPVTLVELEPRLNITLAICFN